MVQLHRQHRLCRNVARRFAAFVANFLDAADEAGKSVCDQAIVFDPGLIEEP
jgi:hypothetical protein